MTEAANGRPRFSAGERTTGEFPHTLPGVRTEVVIFDNSEQMVQSLGSHDEALRFIEEQFPAVRFPRPRQRTGHQRPRRRRSADHAPAPRSARARWPAARSSRRPSSSSWRPLLRSQSLQNPVEVLTHNILSSRGKTIRPKTLNQKNYVDAIDANTVIFGIGPAGTGKTYLAMAKAVQALQQKEVSRIILCRPAVEAGRRLGFLPGDTRGEGQPLPATAALMPWKSCCPHRGDGPAEEPPRVRRHRADAAGLHQRPHAQPRLHHSR